MKGPFKHGAGPNRRQAWMLCT